MTYSYFQLPIEKKTYSRCNNAQDTHSVSQIVVTPPEQCYFHSFITHTSYASECRPMAS